MTGIVRDTYVRTNRLDSLEPEPNRSTSVRRKSGANIPCANATNEASEFFLFSSEVFSTQLFDSSSQFVPEFLSTPKDPPTQLAESDSAKEDSESPTQLADSQFFITQN